MQHDTLFMTGIPSATVKPDGVAAARGSGFERAGAGLAAGTTQVCSVISGATRLEHCWKMSKPHPGA